MEGGSTITQQLVRNLYIARPAGHAEAQDHRGAPRQRGGGPALEGLDPDRVPEHRLLRDQRGRDRGRRRGGGRDLLLQARPRSDPARGGDDRRPAAGALPIQPVPQPAGGARAAQRGAGGDGAAGLHHRERVPGRDRPGSGPQPGAQVQPDPPALHLRPRPAGAPGPLRRQHRPERRAQGLHDDRAAPPGGGAERGRLLLGLLLGRRPGVGARLGRPVERRDRRAGLDPALLVDQPVQLRRPGPAPAGLLVQDLRPDDGDQAGHRPRHDLLRRHLAEDAGDSRAARPGRSTTPSRAAA